MQRKYNILTKYVNGPGLPVYFYIAGKFIRVTIADCSTLSVLAWKFNVVFSLKHF